MSDTVHKSRCSIFKGMGALCDSGCETVTNQKDQPAESLGTCEFHDYGIPHTKRDDCKKWKPVAQPTTRTESLSPSIAEMSGSIEFWEKPGTDSVGAGEPFYNSETGYREDEAGYKKFLAERPVGAQPETEERAASDYGRRMLAAHDWLDKNVLRDGAYFFKIGDRRGVSLAGLLTAFAGRARSVSSPQTPPQICKCFIAVSGRNLECPQHGDRRSSTPSSTARHNVFPPCQHDLAGERKDECVKCYPPDKEKQDAGIGSGTGKGDGYQTDNRGVPNGGTVDWSVGTREIPAASFGDSMEVAPIQSAPDWLETVLWSFVHGAALDLGICKGTESSAAEHQTLYNAMRGACIAYASSSNAAFVWACTQREEWQKAAEAKVIELQNSNWKISAAYEELRAERDRLEQDSIRLAKERSKLIDERDRLQEALRKKEKS